MKRVILTVLMLNFMTSFAEQSFQKRFCNKNNLQSKLLNIYDIDKIEFKNISDKYVMKFHYLYSLSAYYPVKGIDSIIFETDTNNTKLIRTYIFGTPHSFSIAEIYSIDLSAIETTFIEDIIVIDSTK